ncbi:DUF6264 family protein [Agromyces aerolatus]|uniref:DUF6264 family protein n=1 Tax=Agromyces sp. LY-1074 TaxID=3074080 RepID=UPI00286617AB|nr:MULTISPECIES: DUF6264 family protein [unclassified Agromyces]MDR5698862.1 DUF6264 family protein [Agromyces sp. LY-1074]MDR5705360.1 DUF6264 family protein [Agromyces sp. LY-1358]
MTQDEAARPAPETGGRSAAEPAPPRDERPRPRYGEYAPEGWSWQPPGDEHPATDASPSPAAPAAPAQPEASVTGTPAPSTSADPAAPRRAPTWDRIITIALLVLGAFGAWDTARAMQQLGQQIQTTYTMMGIGDFTPPEWLPTLSVIGIVVQLSLYATVLGLTILRMRARRIAFWIPLAGGALSVVITVALMAVVVFSDPTYLEFVQSQIPSPTTAP